MGKNSGFWLSLIGLSVAWAGSASAACDANTRVTGNALRTLVAGQTVCGIAGNDKWQEEHRTNGNLTNGELWDYKKGPNDSVDPQKQVGTWSISGNAITYTYGPNVSYSFTVHDEGNGNGPYSFCNGGSPVVTGASFQSSPDCGF